MKVRVPIMMDRQYRPRGMMKVNDDLLILSIYPINIKRAPNLLYPKLRVPNGLELIELCNLGLLVCRAP